MRKKNLKAGICGSGFAASFQTDMVRRVYGAEVEIAGVFSPNKEHRERFARQKEIPVLESYGELLEKADVVHLCVPSVLHEKLSVEALEAGKEVILEKPFTGYFGSGEEFDANVFDREEGLEQAMNSVKRILKAEASGPGRIYYAENWVYAPAVQKEREIIEKTGAQILWMHGEEAHSGSHSPYYGMWSHSGGGSLMGKGVHPLTAALYLKKVEGRARGGSPLRPKTVSARTHRITGSAEYRDLGHLRTDYQDVEDFACIHVTFTDNTIADVFASEIILGGVHNWLEVAANNHRVICSINPNNALVSYNPKAEYFRDIYVSEKIGTKEGWAFTSPDEDWFTGYQQEMEAFYRNIAHAEEPESDSLLGADTVAAVYAGYLSASRGGQETEVPLI